MCNPPEFLSESDWEAIVATLHLSDREGEIIANVMDGASETEIARLLGISQHTVHTHLERLHRKLHVTSRPQLIARIFATYVNVVHDASPVPRSVSLPASIPGSRPVGQTADTPVGQIADS